MNNIKCPRCSGKMYADHNYKDEAYCMLCGYAEYYESAPPKILPNPFEEADYCPLDTTYQKIAS